MSNDSPVLLFGPWHESRHINQADERDIEVVAKPHKPGPLDRGIIIEYPGQDSRLVGNEPDGLSSQSAESDNEVARKCLVDFKKLLAVEDAVYQYLHIVRLVRVSGDQIVEGGVSSVRRIP